MADQLSLEELRRIAAEVNAEMDEEDRLAGRVPAGKPDPDAAVMRVWEQHQAKQQQANQPEPELSHADKVRLKGEAALERLEQRKKDVALAKALLVERGYTEDEIASINADEALQLVGIEESDAQRERRELQEYDAAVLANPALMEAELAKAAERSKAKQTAGLEAHARRLEAEAARQAAIEAEKRTGF